MTRAPDGVFAFVLYDLPVVDFPYDEARFRVLPRRLNVSNHYYLGGRVHTLDEVESRPDLCILAANMVANDWARVIRTPLGNWQPFEDGDTLIEVATPAPPGDPA